MLLSQITGTPLTVILASIAAAHSLGAQTIPHVAAVNRAPAHTMNSHGTTATLPASERLNGNWRPIAGQVAGKPIPLSQLESLSFIVDQERYVSVGRGLQESGTLRLSPLREGRLQIDFLVENGNNQGRSVPGILAMSADKLIICYSITGSRPRGLESTEFNQALLLEYEKVQNTENVLK